MIPGAFTSILELTTLIKGPAPSIGSPKAFTTRPSKPSPTGISIILPERKTTSPSVISASFPKITTPV
jgi:hypothetical protein